MAVTVEDLLQLALPPGSVVVAGASGLRREVTWASSLRPRPPAFEPLAGGELALISSAHLGSLRESMTLSYVVTRLAEVNVAAIAVQGDVDSEALAVADSAALPLIQLPSDASLPEIERAAIATVVTRQAELQSRAAEIHRQLAQLTFEERGLQAVVGRLAEITGASVVIEDDQFRLQFAAAGADEPGPEAPDLVSARSQLEEWIRTVPLSSTQPPVGRFAVSANSLERFVAPICTRDGVAGYLSLIASGSQMTELNRLATSRGAAVCAVEVAKEAAVGEAEARIRGDLLEQLLSAGLEGDQAALGKAKRLGYDPSLPSLVLAFRIGSRQRARSSSPALSPERLRRQLESLVRVEMSMREPKSLVASRGGTVVAVVPVQDVLSRRLARDLAEEIRVRAESTLGGCPVAVGVGRPTSQSNGSIATSYREAEGALGIGIRVNGPSSATFFGDLGIMRLLAQIASNSELAGFQHEMLGKLQEHDRRAGGELLKTLEVLFQCNGNLTRTADQLSLHRNSLLYRMQRIAEISGHDLEDSETRLSLQVALKTRQLLEAERARGV